ncbi:PhzF family phenazine biosynthesis protein [Nocardioides sp. GXQ0305]|uniref:PhzF family phenazine biosynthesis protein n=1 Tax=Nocardioides sp. GXQ0305 TaxID=3423912 RepID=UPI003D7D7162
MREFRQVDVFSSTPLGGNPVAVVHDAAGLGDERMQEFARWTNLSETTFLLPPTTEEADYRLRIFTPSVELPFAGHPTIGSAHAWLEAGGVPRSGDHVVQECGAGLVRLRRTGGRLAFAAPPLTRSGPVSDDDRAAVLGPLGLTDDDVLDMAWVDNGPGWVGVLLRDADAVLALDPDFYSLRHDVGVVGVRSGGDTACEVRALCPMGSGITEDPVTGSLNAGLAQWLAGSVLPTSYVGAQGTVIGRSGRVHVEQDGDTTWVGGDARTVVRGEVSLD